MTSKDHHAEIVAAATRQMQRLYDTSAQCMYIYMDDENKTCSKKFAAWLGYKSPAEWAAVVDNIPAVFVHQKDVNPIVDAFQAAMGDGVATTLDVTWLRKDGKQVRGRTTLMPFEYEDHRMALHFIQPL